MRIGPYRARDVQRACKVFRWAAAGAARSCGAVRGPGQIWPRQSSRLGDPMRQRYDNLPSSESAGLGDQSADGAGEGFGNLRPSQSATRATVSLRRLQHGIRWLDTPTGVVRTAHIPWRSAPGWSVRQVGTIALAPYTWSLWPCLRLVDGSPRDHRP